METFQLSTQLLTYWHVPAQTRPATIQITGYQEVYRRLLGTFQLTSGRLPGPGEIVMDVSDRTALSVAIGDRVKLDTPNAVPLTRSFFAYCGACANTRTGLLAIKTQGLAYMNTAVLQRLAVSLPSGQGAGHFPFLGTQIMVQTPNATPASQTYQAMSRILNGAHITIYDFFSPPRRVSCRPS